MALGWGMVSTGRHPDAKMAPAINAAQEATLAAVCSRDVGQAREFARKHGARAAYDSYEEMLQDPNVDVVYIASPNSLHAEHTIKAARAGKHVLCEKPMALTMEQCHSMVDTCTGEGVKLGVCFHLRHHPGHEEFRQLVQGGALGTLSLVQAQFSSGQLGQAFPSPRSGRTAWWDQPEMAGAGAMMAMGVHVVDILRYVLGQEVAEVVALTDGQTAERPLEQLTTMLLRFQDGTLGMVYASRRTPDPMNHLIVHGSGGRIACYDSLSTTLQGQLEVRAAQEPRTQSYSGDGVAMYTSMVEAFNRAVVEDREPGASGWDGLRVAQVTIAMVESAKTGRTVKLETV